MRANTEHIDDLNATIVIKIAKVEYEPNVERILKSYVKSANVPGYRKGEVPMAYIEKQYGNPLRIDAINKMLQEKLNSHIASEKLDLLGQPIPKESSNINWEDYEHVFEFEIGKVPTFDIDISSIPSVERYDIKADEQMVTEQLDRARKQFGKMSAKETVEAGDDIAGTFKNTEAEIDTPGQFNIDSFASEDAKKALMGKKVGDVVSISTKGLFADPHKLMDLMKIDHDAVHDLEVNVDFTIEEINHTELSDITPEFLDKIFGVGNVSTEDDARIRLKADIEQQLTTQADQKFLNDATQMVLENTKFDLPKEFLTKWIQVASKDPMDAEQAKLEYEKSENGLRYQLIEAKIIEKNNLKLQLSELKAYTSELIKRQMAQFGQMDPTAADVDAVVTRIMSNQDEAKRLSEQLMSMKMLELFKAKVPSTVKTIYYPDFVKEMYGE